MFFNKKWNNLHTIIINSYSIIIRAKARMQHYLTKFEGSKRKY